MSRPAQPHAHDSVAEQAAHWLMRLTADSESERRDAQTGFEAWKRTDPRHAAAARELEQMIAQLHSVRGADNRPARAALAAAFAGSRRRKRLKRASAALVVALALAVPAWLALQSWPPAYLTADLRTATGQWTSSSLPDGTRITLDSASAVNLHYAPQQRLLDLVQGQILVEVAPDAQRPFLVETGQGRIRALGTRFMVERRGDATVLSMLESRVSVQTAAQVAAGSDTATIVEAGQRVHITRDAIGQIESLDTDAVAEAWRHRQLLVLGRPLPQVLDELARHRPGYLRYDRAQLDGIHVDAVLPLDDTDRALDLLQASFPALRVRKATPWLVLVDMPPRP